jgi:hypothetical protein
METLIIFVGVLQDMAISLGVGVSTMAVLNFFLAIRDGKIDETERSFMGITYFVLRIAMVTILFTMAILAYFGFANEGSVYFNNYIIAQFILIGVLYINAILMTLHIMPSTFGPAIQASTWYTLGILLAFYAQGVEGFSMLTFLLGYITMFLMAVAIINGVMAHLKSLKSN